MSKDERDVEKQERPVDSFSKRFYLILAVTVAILAGSYFSNFHGGFGTQEQFGAFGDFFGGLLNPLLSFITILLLLQSLSYQRSELKATREELAATREELSRTANIHKDNMRHNMAVEFHEQVRTTFENRCKEINQLVRREFYATGRNPLIPHETSKSYSFLFMERNTDLAESAYIIESEGEEFFKKCNIQISLILEEVFGVLEIANEFESLKVHRLLFVPNLHKMRKSLEIVTAAVKILPIEDIETGRLMSLEEMIQTTTQMINRVNSRPPL